MKPGRGEREQEGVLRHRATLCRAGRLRLDAKWAPRGPFQAKLAASLGDAAGDRVGEVRQALIDVLAPYRTTDGGYRLENEWHYLVGRA